MQRAEEAGLTAGLAARARGQRRRSGKHSRAEWLEEASLRLQTCCI